MSGKITLTKVNNEVIVPYKIKRYADDEILGFNAIPYLYVNTFITAPTNAGKSTIVSHIIKSCIDKDTMVLIFCATFYGDPEWEKNEEYMEKKGIEYKVYTGITEGKGRNKINHLSNMIEIMKEEAAERKAEKKLAKLEAEERKKKKYVERKKYKPRPLFLFSDSEEDTEEEEAKEEKRKKKKKLKSPEYLVIFDDISGDIRRDPVMSSFLKMARHWCCKVVVSSQSFHDLAPDSREACRLWFFLKGVNPDKLKDFYEDMSLTCGLKNFLKMYKNATSVPFGWLNVNVPKGIFKSKFDSIYNVPNEDTAGASKLDTKKSDKKKDLDEKSNK